MRRLGVRDFSLSGGEPTVHPDFLRIVDYITRDGDALHILSNGERFGDDAFVSAFLGTVSGHDVSITTTFHSSDEKEHEYQNRSRGSFQRSLRGLKRMDEAGLNLAIKQCLTKRNYLDLKGYLKFVTDSFSERVEIQLWGLDLVGVSSERVQDFFVEYDILGRELESALDYFESLGRNQALNINNLPLCLVDCRYWRYFSDSDVEDYIEKDGSHGSPEHGPVSSECTDCPLQNLCMGTYHSVFEMLGDSIVKVPDVSFLFDVRRTYASYDETNVDKLYFSPYADIWFTKSGLHLKNDRIGVRMDLRARSSELRAFLSAFSSGCNETNARSICETMGKENLLEDLIYFGVVE